MEDGLFLWLIIFAVAILQGIGQRKKKQGQKPGQKPGSRSGPVPESSRRRPPRTRSEPDQTRGDPLSDAPSGTTLASSSDQGRGKADPSSEGMIPADVWEEILGLARGKPPTPKPGPTPEPEPGFEPEPAFEPRQRHEAEPVPEAEAISETGESSWLAYEANLGGRRPQVDRQPMAARELGSNRGVAAPIQGVLKAGEGGGVREDLFGSGSPEELRKAIILKEVLGLPLALRED